MKLSKHLKIKFLYLLTLCLFLSPARAQQLAQDPAIAWGELFVQVQESGIFPDSKTFPDAQPKRAISAILADYRQQKSQADFDLTQFVEANFQLPATFESNFESETEMAQHLERLWVVLRRPADKANTGSSLLPLPYPYIVPGGRFREVYYWDSYFTMLGLQVSGKYELMENILDNFAYLIKRYSFMPNGNRSYYLSRSQPPFFALMVQLLAKQKGKDIWLKYGDALQIEYDFWMKGETELSAENSSFRRVVRLGKGEILNRYWDNRPAPRSEAWIEDKSLAQASNRSTEEVYRNLRAACESGWDFSSRWLKNPQDLSSIITTEIIPVDLNCLLYYLEKTLAQSYQLQNDPTKAKYYQKRAKRRAKLIRKYCWDSSKGFFCDYHFPSNSSRELLTMAGAYPLFFEIAKTSQAKQVAKILEEDFLREGGLRSTLQNTGQQWDAPNAWAPLQWIGYQALQNYHFKETAQKIRSRWLKLNEKVFAATGKMMEKYDVENLKKKAGGGEYPNQDGFGWTNGVYLKMKSGE